MKNRIKNCISFFLIVYAIVPLYAIQRSHVKKEVATAQAIAQEVSKDVSLLDQIIEQSDIIVNTTNTKERMAAKRELTRLMNHKDLDHKVKVAIEKDIKIIQNKSTSKDAHDAFDRLLAISDKIEAEVNAIAIAAQAAKAVETASPEELEQVIAQAQKNMEEADKEVKEEQSTVRRLYSRAKRLVTAPVDYVFGEESSKAKTAFYAAVGTAAAAAIILYGKREYDSFIKLKSDLEDAKNILYKELPEDATIQDMENRRNALHDLWRNFAVSRGKNYLSEDEFEEFKKLGSAVINEEHYYDKLIEYAKIGQMDQGASIEPSNWLADIQFKNEEENLPKRFNELKDEFAPISSYRENIKPKAIEYRLEEWEKLINDLNRHNQSLPSSEKQSMLKNAMKILNELKEQQESFLQQQARKEEYEKHNLEEYLAQ